MISVKDLVMSFGARTLFEDVCFNINSRERIGLVGRNGSGKTTLFNLLTGKIRQESGMIAIPNNYSIGYVQQHLTFSKETLIDEACLGLKPQDIDSVWLVEKVLMGLGFSAENMQEHPSKFSGGFQVRLNLAKALVSNPDLLLLDEPTNYLDILSIRWLESFLRRWPSELMVITHDRSFMDSITTHTMILHRNKAKKIKGDTSKLYEQIAVEEEIYENARIKDEKQRKQTEIFINRFRAKARLASMVQSRIKALEKKEKMDKLDQIESLEFGFNTLPFPTKRIMEVKNIGFGYDPAQQLIKDLTLSIAKDDRICVIGKNGKGKSTFLKLLIGELDPQEGSLYGHPEMVAGYFGQTNVERLQVHKTVEEELMASDPDHNRKKARDICGSMMFQGDDALKKISVLSGGEKSRVLLGKILLTPINLLLLDEPTNHLDMDSCDSLLAALDSFKGATIVVTHNEMFLHELANRLIVFENDKVFVFEGSYQEFLDQIGWEEEAGVSKKKSDGVRSENKKQRSTIINQRSKTLFPIEKTIRNIEQKIAMLEKQVNTNNEQIALASGQNKGNIISDLSVENHQLTAKVNALFVDLETAFAKHDMHEKAFEKQLKELE